MENWGRLQIGPTKPMHTLRISNGRVIDPSQGSTALPICGFTANASPALGRSRTCSRPHHRRRRQDRLSRPDRHARPSARAGPGGRRNHRHRLGGGPGGGHYLVACMPNTEPALDNQTAAEFVYLQAERAGNANVFPIGAITKGRAGAELAEIGGSWRATPSPSPITMLRSSAPRSCAGPSNIAGCSTRPVLCHAEDLELTRDGVMHEGFESMRLGLRGMPACAEEVIIHRDIELAQLTERPFAHLARLQRRQHRADSPRQGQAACASPARSVRIICCSRTSA